MPDHLSSSPRRRFSWRVKVLALGLSSIVALGLAEVGWRLFRTPGYGPTTNPYYVEHDPELGWRYSPGAKVRHQTQDFDVAIRINEKGQRDDPVSFERTDGRQRLLLLGDSLTFGWGVEEKESFASQLEDSLGAEVVNLAISGFGTDQELLLFRRLGHLYHADVVILTVCANDVEECSRERMYGKGKPRFVLHGDRLELVRDHVEQSFLERVSHLYRSLWGKWIAARTPPLTDAQRQEGQQLVRALIRELSDEVRAAGGKLLVVSEGERWLGSQRIEGTEIPHLDVRDTLSQAEQDGPVRFAHDPHWTAHGHQVVAQTIGDHLRALGWLK
ncbi:MAG: GDSL-type esterase/lipase family protein [Planctomycetota bacterium]